MHVLQLVISLLCSSCFILHLFFCLWCLLYSPHINVPDNLVKAIRTAALPDAERVLPDPNEWPTPYGFYAVGEGTNCPASHFRNMRLVLNTAFW